MPPNSICVSPLINTGGRPCRVDALGNASSRAWTCERVASISHTAAGSAAVGHLLRQVVSPDSVFVGVVELPVVVVDAELSRRLGPGRLVRVTLSSLW